MVDAYRVDCWRIVQAGLAGPVGYVAVRTGANIARHVHASGGVVSFLVDLDWAVIGAFLVLAVETAYLENEKWKRYKREGGSWNRNAGAGFRETADGFRAAIGSPDRLVS